MDCAIQSGWSGSVLFLYASDTFSHDLAKGVSRNYFPYFYPKTCCGYSLFSLVLHKNICCGYSLEAPHWGTSNEYHNIYFYTEALLMSTHNIYFYAVIRKILVLFIWKKRRLIWSYAWLKCLLFILHIIFIFVHIMELLIFIIHSFIFL